MVKVPVSCVLSNAQDYLVVIYSKKPLNCIAQQSEGKLPLYGTDSPLEAESTFSAYFTLNLNPPLAQDLNIQSALLELEIQASYLQGTDIRFYRALGPTALMKPAEFMEPFSPLTSDPPYLVSVALSPNPNSDESEADFNAWYEHEHIQLLSKVPGWLACRRYILLDELRTPDSTSNANAPLRRSPQYLALHALKHPNDAFGSPEHKAATNTPWRTRIMSGIVAKERYIFRLT
ncbi:hypothetical protein D9757_011427 [Collybiopsis confluens]|uniref:Uncharacterized protein n=1 Tax=Collybiopsis confluens TaxID=2823264 RepID=A0A8H5GHU6_9AGAR|nr:hypothetical protein D9757_011427 [Collybiopsis confluens]